MKRSASTVLLALAVSLVVACGGGSSDSSVASSPVAPSSPTPPPPPPAPDPPPPVQVPVGCTPAAPANLVVTMSDTRVTLTWSAVSGATEYVVLVGTSPSSSNEILTNTTNTTYQWNGAKIGQHYARIQAKNSCGTSGSSNEVAFTVTSNTFGG